MEQSLAIRADPNRTVVGYARGFNNYRRLGLCWQRNYRNGFPRDAVQTVANCSNPNVVPQVMDEARDVAFRKRRVGLNAAPLTVHIRKVKPAGTSSNPHSPRLILE